ncbi:HdeD family acid-resistance protein [Achromobacter sp. 413638]|uniref:HdeD family acid-resistance protein n=1 Tax=Achromobacter sp. 413638 TaxID=3342385 RepID=UPI00370C220A
MGNLVLLLLGVDYLRKRALGLAVAGWLLLVAGAVVFIDALDGVLYFPLDGFAALIVIEGLATLAIAKSGVGGQRVLRYVKGLFVLTAGVLVLAGDQHGHFVLSMIFGLLFLVDGLMQCIAAYVVRYARWRYVFASGVAEILLAIFFFQPYPTHYVGTVPYCVGLFLAFSGFKLLVLARRVRTLGANPGLVVNARPDFMPTASAGPAQTVFDGPPLESERALTVHVWTPSGSAKAQTRNYLMLNRYIAAVDVNGVISTGHAALESPEGVYVSLYPAQEIDRSPEQFGALLRATAENDVPGVFQPDYATEAQAWCPSTTQVRIRNYDAAKLQAFWDVYRQDATYNLTHRNCSSSVSRALEAALDGVVGRLHGPQAGWRVLLRLLLTPELWVASQIRKRALTMAWTPGLTLDYARALSMLADPRPFGWWQMSQAALRLIRLRRAAWRSQDREAQARNAQEAPSSQGAQ